MFKTVDAKSFLIGFLLALVLVLLMGAGSSSDVQDVRIVGVSGYPLPVELKSSSPMEVELVDFKYGLELPVVVKKN